ncbi:MAG: DUF58 domain-containing protein [Spirochaetes bacterium]|nr:DUF58 domain-containing protein [Spirochaetota bacterium]
MKILKSISVTGRFFTALASLVLIYAGGFFLKPLVLVTDVICCMFVIICIIEIYLLYTQDKILELSRSAEEKLSNGGLNTIRIRVKSFYRFPLMLEIIDELPEQLQIRDFKLGLKIFPGEDRLLNYTVRPLKRGQYFFGNINVKCSVFSGLISRRIVAELPQMYPVYPSVKEMKKFGFYASSNRLENIGMKKIYRTGYSYEFEQIRRFANGDDIRKINWKATSKSGFPMINTFKEEKSQDIYSIIDMGRAMQMPFGGMTLLDYAVNSCLALSGTAVSRNDNSGLITFAEKIYSFLPAQKNSRVMNRILETLYSINTSFREPDYEKLFFHIERYILKRSLLIFFSNFETLYSLDRNIRYLRLLAKKHHVVVVIFRNSEVASYTVSYSGNVKDIYVKTMAEKYLHEKEMIAGRISGNNMQAVLTDPVELTPHIINKYIEIKMRGLM